MKILLTTALTGALLLLGNLKANALYDGSIGTPPSNRPANQGWTYVPNLPFSGTPSSTESSDSAGTILNSTANNTTQSGYGRTDTLLNSAAGYNLRFDLQLLQDLRNASTNPNPADNNGDGKDDRAGLSILVVSSDITKAIEIGFFVDRVWVQEDGAVKAAPGANPQGTRFTQAEGAAFDTKTNVNQYDLSILGNSYFIYTNGNYSTPLLTGRLRDYTTEPTVAPFPNPYRTANTIFIGDNTTAAGAEFRLNKVAYSSSAITSVPFAFNPLFGVGLFGLSRLRKAVKARQSAN